MRLWYLSKIPLTTRSFSLKEGLRANGQGQTRDLQDGHTRDCRKCPGQGLNILIPACTDEKEKVMAPHSSAPAWKIPWTEEPGGLRSLGSLRVGHD